MKLLLDTHTFLWFVQGSDELSRRALDAILDERNDLCLSAASSWEICMKVSLGRLELRKNWPTTFGREMTLKGIGGLEIKREHLLGVVGLPFIHRDPFDRLLVAQARHERCAVATSDTHIPKDDLKCVW